MANEKVLEAEIADENSLSKKEMKKLKKQQKKQDKKTTKKRGGFMKLVLFFVIILGAVFALLYLDVFGIRSTYVDDKILGTPLESIFSSAKNSDGETSSLSRGDLLMQVEELKAQVADLESELEDTQEMNDLYISQLGQIEPLAQEQLKFKEDKEEFDRMIAEGDQNAFIAFYEDMYPDTAREVYESITGSQTKNSEVTSYVANFTAMDEDKAANILELMAITDIDLVVEILKNMSSEKSGTILAEMNPESAAGIAKRMAPVNY